MKKCFVCNSDGTKLNEKEVRCSNENCRLHNTIFTIDEWDSKSQSSMNSFEVVFHSPGTFMTENTTLKIDAINKEDLLKKAVEKATSITERYNAIPFMFVINEPAFKRSSYYLSHNVILRKEDIPKTKEMEILISNCEGNGWNAIAKTIKGWTGYHPFEKDDYLLDDKGNIIDSGKNYY